MDEQRSLLDVEAQTFVEGVSEALQFATLIIQQLPQSDPRRKRLADQLDEQVQKHVAAYDNAVKNLFDPGTLDEDEATDIQVKAAELLRNPESSLIVQMRVLRGYYAGKCWESVIKHLSCLLEETQRQQLLSINNFRQFDAEYESYHQLIEQANKYHKNNLDAVAGQFLVQQQLVSTSTQMNNELTGFGKTKKKIVVEADQAVIQIAEKCDQLVQDIEALSETVALGESDANNFKYRISLLTRPRNKNLLTLQQTINQINDIYKHKKLNDKALVKQKKQLRTIRQFIYNYFLNKYGNTQYSLKNINTKKFFYSLAYYKNVNSVCFIFYNEYNNEIDESFKDRLLEMEKGIDALYEDKVRARQSTADSQGSTGRSKLSNEEINYEVLNSVYDGESSIVAKLFNQIQGEHSLKELKNVIDIFEVEKHRTLLAGLHKQFLERDRDNMGVVTAKGFAEIAATYCSDRDTCTRIVHSATRGQGFVTFTAAVISLSLFIFSEAAEGMEEAEEGEEADKIKAETQKLQLHDL